MKKTWVLYDSENYMSEDEYKKMIEEEGMDKENCLDYWDWVADTLSEDYEDLRHQVERIFPYEECVIVGSVGLWYGRRDIEPTKVRSVFKAIEKCCSNMDSVVIKQVNGHFEIKAGHHDGSNYFDIYLLNEKGIYTQKGNLANRRYHKAIKQYVFDL